MIPILHDVSGTTLTNMGLGALGDAISCKVSAEINGPYTLSMSYPLDGPLAGEIQPERIIWAVPEDGADPQPFQIVSTRRTMAGTIQAEAKHLGYYRAGFAVAGPFTAYTASEAMAALGTQGSGLTFWTDVPDIAHKNSTTLTYTTPGQISDRLTDIQEMYGGEYAWDGLAVKLYARRGQDRGVQILYGKNLTSLQQDKNNEAVYTAIYPYATAQDGGLLTIAGTPKTISTGLELGYSKILAVDYTARFKVESDKTQNVLRIMAEQDLAKGKYKTPTVALTVSFAALGKTTEYKEYAALERVCLGDTVHVAMESMGVNVAARVTALTFDVLRETCDTVSIGSELQTLPRTLAGLIEEVKRLGG